jgi:hypothetical protein
VVNNDLTISERPVQRAPPHTTRACARTLEIWSLGFGICLGSGTWDLGFPAARRRPVAAAKACRKDTRRSFHAHRSCRKILVDRAAGQNRPGSTPIPARVNRAPATIPTETRLSSKHRGRARTVVRGHERIRGRSDMRNRRTGALPKRAAGPRNRQAPSCVRRMPPAHNSAASHGPREAAPSRNI